MERLLRLTEFWSWLPAFRAVAESQHLPTAAEMLQVGPSSLSRSIRLLENKLGVELFERVGRRILLTEDGREFLVATRRAMRLIDDGVEALISPELRGMVRIASTGTILSIYLLQALRDLRADHPELVPIVEVGIPDRANEMLQRGVIDVAFLTRPVVDDDLESTPLGHYELAVYCGPGHPLHEGADSVTLDDLLEHEFVAPPDDGQGLPVDGWPAATPRRVGMVLDQLRAGCDVCAGGDYLAVLPRVLVDRHEPRLRALVSDLIPPVEIHAVHRTVLATGRRADQVVVQAVAARIAEDQAAR